MLIVSALTSFNYWRLAYAVLAFIAVQIFVPIMFGQTDIVKTFSDADVILLMRSVLVSESWHEGLSEAERFRLRPARMLS